MGKHPDLPVLKYRHTETGEEHLVYEGTGAHDAFRTDPAYERVSGEDPSEVVASKTEKVGIGDDLSDLSTPELRQLAAQAGHPDPFALDREEALEVAERRAERLEKGILQMPGDETKEQAVRDGAEGDGDGDGDVVSADRTRPELNALAKEAGVEEPEKLRNRQAVVDAIHEAKQGD